MKMKWNRFLALALAVIMVIGMVPVSARAATAGDTLYLKTNSDWRSASARIAAYFFNDSGSSQWENMTDADADGIYQVVIPSGSWTKVIFCRMNPATTENNWDNKWTQTGDLSLSSGNYFTITGWETGTWSTNSPSTPTYYVPGDEALTGENWQPGKNPMTDADGDGTYEKVFTNIAAGTYKYKIAVNGTWDVTWSNGSANDTDGNSAVTVDTDGSTVTIAFNPSTKAVSATVCAHENTEDRNNTATCTTPGTKDIYCTDCKTTIQTGVAVEATGVHTYENGFCTGCKRPDYIYVTYSGSVDSLTVKLYDEDNIGITTETEPVTNETFGESYIKVELPSDAAYIEATLYGSYSTSMKDITAGKNMLEVSFGSSDLVGTWGTYCAHADCDEVTSAANCTDAGSTTYTCKNESCKATKTVTIRANGHTFENGKCSACGIPQVIYVDCGGYGPDDYYNFSCIVDGYGPSLGEENRVSGNTYKITLGTDAKTIQFSSTAYMINYKSSLFEIADYTTGENEGNNLFTVTGVDGATLTGEWGKYCPHTNKTTVTTESSCLTKGTETVTCDACKEVVSTRNLDMLGHDWTNGDICAREGCYVPHYFYVDFGSYYENYTYEADVYSCYNPEGTDPNSGFNYKTCASERVTEAVFKFTVPQYAAADNSYGDDAIILTACSEAMEGYYKTWDTNFDSTGKILYSGDQSAWIDCPDTYGTTEEVTLAATCITAGTKINKCVVCGATVSTGDVPVTGEHVYGENGYCTTEGCDAYDGLIRNEEQLKTALTNSGGCKLGADIALSDIVQTGSGVELTLDLNGHSIGGSSYIWVASSTLNLKNSGEAATVTEIRCGGTSTVAVGEKVTVTKLAPGDGNVITNNGTIGEIYIYADATTYAGFDCTIKGAYGNVTISNSDYKVVETATEDGTVLTIEKKVYVAQIGENKYESLPEAIAYAKATDGVETIKLLGNIVTESLITIDTPVELELAGYSITRAGTTDGSVTVFVTSEDVEILRGSIENTGSGVGLWVAAGGSACLFDTNVIGADYGIWLAGSETSDASANVQIISQSSAATVTSANIGIAATGCSVVTVSDADVSGGNVGIYANGDVLLNINSGTVKGTIVDQNSGTGDGIRAYGNASVNMIGGTVSGSATGAGIELYQNATARVWNDQESVPTVVNGESGICVYGGKLTVEKGAAISGTDVAICTGPNMADESQNGEYIKAASITITGGTITGGNGVIETRTLPEGSTLTDSTSVSGGTFSHAVESEYCADGYVPSGNDTDGYGVKTATVILDAIEAAYDSEIQLWMKVYIADTLLEQENAYIEMTKAGGYGNETVKITMADLGQQTKDDEGRYKLAMGIASGEMTCGVTYKIVDGEGNAVDLVTGSGADKGTVATFSVMDYVQLIMANGTDAQKDMVKALVTYGGYAQVHFGVETGNLAYGETAPELADVNITESSAVSGDNIGVAATSMQAFLDSAIYLRVYFTLEEGKSIDNYTFTLGNAQLTPVAQNGRYYVDILDIPAAYLDKMYTITVTDGTGTYTVTTSVLVWIKNMLNDTSITEAHSNLLKAMYWYNQEANEFFPGY